MQLIQAALQSFVLSATQEAQLSYAANPLTETKEQVMLQAAESEETHLKWLGEEMLYSQAFWKGLYSGLYSVSKSGMVPKPGKECLG